MHAAGWFCLGAPWDCSGSGRGEQAAPAALRSAGLGRLVGADAGDADTVIGSAVRDRTTGVLALPQAVRAATDLDAALDAAMRGLPGRRPLVVGGDCSILLGIVPALRRRFARVGLWFVDGHPDYLDGASSETGETADMALAVVTGSGAEALVTLARPAPMVAISDVVLLGHRTTGLDDASAAEVRRLPAGLRRADAAAVSRDPQGCARQAEAVPASACDGVWLHLDVDVLDPGWLPAVTYPQPGGPDGDQLARLLTPLGRSPRLLGVSVADYRPDLDPDGRHARRLVELLDAVLP